MCLHITHSMLHDGMEALSAHIFLIQYNTVKLGWSKCTSEHSIIVLAQYASQSHPKRQRKQPSLWTSSSHRLSQACRFIKHVWKLRGVWRWLKVRIEDGLGTGLQEQSLIGFPRLARGENLDVSVLAIVFDTQLFDEWFWVDLSGHEAHVIIVLLFAERYWEMLTATLSRAYSIPHNLEYAI